MTEQTTALVTGANKGIGYEIAAGLGAPGWKVGVGARNDKRREAAVVKLREAGVDAFGVALDVTDDASVAAAATAIEQQAGGLDVLVNNAGVTGGGPQEPTTVDVERVREAVETNVIGVIRVTNAMVHRGSLDDLDALGAAAAASDGVVHLAFKHEEMLAGDTATAADADRRAIEALGDVLQGSDRPLVIASGLAGLPPGTPATEDDVPDSSSPRAVARSPSGRRSRWPTAACAPSACASHRPCTATATRGSWPS